LRTGTADNPKENVTLDQVTGNLSPVLGGGNLDLAKEFLRFVERHKNEGNVAKSEEPAYREGTAYFLESSGYEQAIGAARLHAGTRPEAERQGIYDVADRAERRLDSNRAGLLTPAKAKRELAKLPIPSESAAGIAKSLGTQTFKSIRRFGRWMDERFLRRYGIMMFLIGHQAALKRAAWALACDVLNWRNQLCLCGQPERDHGER
jgi:hypothetical protein